MPRHLWSKVHIRVVFAVCQANTAKKDRMRLLHVCFPDCSVGSLQYQIIRYQKRNDGTLRWIPEQGIFEGYGANGRLHNEVWTECDWKS